MTTESIDVACLERGADGNPILRLALSTPCPPVEDDRARTLREIVETHGLQGMPCACVLDSDQHAVRLIDAPAVPDEELLEASRWAVQDSVDFPVEDAAIEVASRTPAAASGRGARLVVVAARGSAVREIAALARRCGLDPRAVCAPESALAALAPRGDEPKGSALLRLDAKHGLLVIGRGGTLCVTRSVPSDIEAFANLPAGDARAPDDARIAVEELALEVQRSLDFFDASFGRTPVATLWIAPGDVEPEAVGPALERNIGVRVRAFDVGEHFAGQGTLTQSVQARVMPALGAAIFGQRENTATNLLTSLRAEPKKRFRAREVAVVALALAGLLAAVHAFGAFRLARERSALAALESEQATMKSQIAELTARQKAGDDRVLANELVRLRAERDARARELRLLASDPSTEARRFAGVLESLARHPVDGVWLRSVRIANGGATLGLEGSSLASDGVSNLLTALEDEPRLSGVRFGALRAMRSEEDPDRIDFAVGDAAEGVAR